MKGMSIWRVLGEALADVLAFEDFRADIDVAGFQTYLPFLDALPGNSFQFVESIFAVFGFVSACLWHAAHPFQFRAVQVVGSCNLGAFVVDALLSLFQIVGVVAAVGIDSLVVEFEDEVAHAVEEETVVGDHE